MLLDCTKDEIVTSIISKCSNRYRTGKIVYTHRKDKDPEEHGQPTGVAEEGKQPTPKKKRVRLETIQKPSSWTKLHCVCGITNPQRRSFHS